MNRIAPLLVMLLLVITSGCQKSADDDSFNPVFPEEINFKKEAARLDSLRARVTKSIQSTDTSETRTVNPNWENELRPFTSAFMEAGYLDDYKKEVIALANNASVITYTNQSDNSIRMATFYTTNGRVNGLEIHKKDNRIIYEIEKHLVFFKDSLYHISSRQDIPLIFEDSISIKGTIHLN